MKRLALILLGAVAGAQSLARHDRGGRVRVLRPDFGGR